MSDQESKKRGIGTANEGKPTTITNLFSNVDEVIKDYSAASMDSKKTRSVDPSLSLEDLHQANVRLNDELMRCKKEHQDCLEHKQSIIPSDMYSLLYIDLLYDETNNNFYTVQYGLVDIDIVYEVLETTITDLKTLVKNQSATTSDIHDDGENILDKNLTTKLMENIDTLYGDLTKYNANIYNKSVITQEVISNESFVLIDPAFQSLIYNARAGFASYRMIDSITEIPEIKALITKGLTENKTWTDSLACTCKFIKALFEKKIENDCDFKLEETAIYEWAIDNLYMLKKNKSIDDGPCSNENNSGYFSDSTCSVRSSSRSDSIRDYDSDNSDDDMEGKPVIIDISGSQNEHSSGPSTPKGQSPDTAISLLTPTQNMDTNQNDINIKKMDEIQQTYEGGQKGGQLTISPTSILPPNISEKSANLDNFTKEFYAIIDFIAPEFFYADSLHDFKKHLPKSIVQSITDSYMHLSTKFATIQKNINIERMVTGLDSDLKQLRDDYKLCADREWGGNETIMAYRHKKDNGLSELLIIKIIPFNINNLNDPNNFYKDPDVLKNLGEAGYICRSTSSAPSDPNDAKYKWQDTTSKQWYTFFIAMYIDGSPVTTIGDNIFDNTIRYQDNGIPVDVLAILYGLSTITHINIGGLEISFNDITQANEDVVKNRMNEINNMYVAGAADPSTTASSIQVSEFDNTTNPISMIERLDQGLPEDQYYSKIALKNGLQVFLNVYTDDSKPNAIVKDIRHALNTAGNHEGIQITIGNTPDVDNDYMLHLKDTSIDAIQSLVEQISAANIYYGTLISDPSDFQPLGLHTNRVILLSIMYYNNIAATYKENIPMNKNIFMSVILMWKAFGDYWQVMYVYALNYFFDYPDPIGYGGRPTINNETKAFISSTDKNVALQCLLTGTKIIVGNTSVHLPPLFNAAESMKEGATPASLINENNENLVIKQVGKALVSNLLENKPDVTFNIMKLRSDLFDLLVRKLLIEGIPQPESIPSPPQEDTMDAIENPPPPPLQIDLLNVRDTQEEQDITTEYAINYIRSQLLDNKRVVSVLLNSILNDEEKTNMNKYFNDKITEINTKISGLTNKLSKLTSNLDKVPLINSLQNVLDFLNNKPGAGPNEEDTTTTEGYLNIYLSGFQKELNKLLPNTSSSVTTAQDENTLTQNAELEKNIASFKSYIEVVTGNKSDYRAKKNTIEFLSKTIATENMNILKTTGDILACETELSELNYELNEYKNITALFFSKEQIPLEGPIEKFLEKYQRYKDSNPNVEAQIMFKIINCMDDINLLCIKLGYDFTYIRELITSYEDDEIDIFLKKSHQEVQKYTLMLDFHPKIRLLLPNKGISELKDIHTTFSDEYYEKCSNKIIENAADNTRDPFDTLKAMQLNHIKFLNKFNVLNSDIESLSAKIVGTNYLQYMVSFRDELVDVGENCVKRLKILDQRIEANKDYASKLIDADAEHKRILEEVVDAIDLATTNDTAINAAIDSLMVYFDRYINPPEQPAVKPKTTFAYPTLDVYRKLFKLHSTINGDNLGAFNGKFKEEQFRHIIENMRTNTTVFTNKEKQDFLKTIVISKIESQAEIQGKIEAYLNAANGSELNEQEIDSTFNALTNVNDTDIRLSLMDEKISKQHKKVLESIRQYNNDAVVKAEKKRAKAEAEKIKEENKLKREEAKLKKGVKGVKGLMKSTFASVTAAASSIAATVTGAVAAGVTATENFIEKLTSKQMDEIKKMMAPIIKEINGFKKKPPSVIVNMLNAANNNLAIMTANMSESFKKTKRAAMLRSASFGLGSSAASSSSSSSSSSSTPISVFGFGSRFDKSEGGVNIMEAGTNYKRTSKHRPKKYHKYTRVKHTKININKSRKRVKKQHRKRHTYSKK
jgi:hypothetical protein